VIEQAQLQAELIDSNDRVCAEKRGLEDYIAQYRVALQEKAQCD